MRKITEKQYQLIAEYFANIAVAWFAAGVIGPFIVSFKNLSEILTSITVGMIFSGFSLYAGFYTLKEAR